MPERTIPDLVAAASEARSPLIFGQVSGTSSWLAQTSAPSVMRRQPFNSFGDNCETHCELSFDDNVNGGKRAARL